MHLLLLSLQNPGFQAMYVHFCKWLYDFFFFSGQNFGEIAECLRHWLIIFMTQSHPKSTTIINFPPVARILYNVLQQSFNSNELKELKLEIGKIFDLIPDTIKIPINIKILIISSFTVCIHQLIEYFFFGFFECRKNGMV